VSTEGINWTDVFVETETIEKYTLKESIEIVNLATEKMHAAIERLSAIDRGELFIAIVKKISEALQPCNVHSRDSSYLKAYTIQIVFLDVLT
jgi:uncharacterized protein YktB (UPF0637 family)